MPVFMCSKCGCIENTAVSNYWTRNMHHTGLNKPDNPPLCSECDPEIGKWHGRFEKKSAIGLFVGEDGFLYDAPHTINHTKIVGIVHEKGINHIDKIEE